MTRASGAVTSISNNFSKTNQTYSEYGSKISKSQKLVQEIQRKEYMDNLKFMTSFYAFMLSAAYMFLKRFYLHQIVGLAFKILFWSLKNTLLPGIFLVQSIFTFDFLNFYVDPPLTSLLF